jgi:hypothetical protein
VTKKNVIDIICNKGNLNLSEKTVISCYSCSKMSVKDIRKDEDKLDKMQFVEFLELVCRIAFEKFRDTDLTNLKLENKLERVIGMIVTQHKTPPQPPSSSGLPSARTLMKSRESTSIIRTANASRKDSSKESELGISQISLKNSARQSNANYSLE